ncbi:MAG: GAF domain-containing protein, partial [Chloroflexales bacterium]|nr:GAF domain-containing protein [Chloroflexales bacterium]
MAAPLLRQGRLIGAVAVERDQPGCYGDEEQQALLALVGQAAVAMENAALYAEAQERSNRLKVVSELFDDVSSTRNLAGVLQTIVQRIRMFVPCDYASIAHYEASNNSFLLETLYDATSAELPAATRYGAGDTPWKSVFDTGVPSYSRDMRQSTFAVEQQLAAVGLRAYVAVPIASAGGSLGTLNLASRTPAAFSQEQIGTLTELSRYLASAMLNASQRLERERTVSELARAQERLALTARLNAVGELAGGIAHDFNNLLAGILGNAQLLLFEAQSDDQRDMLRVIERAARGGAETVRRLQTFTRIDHDSAVGEVQLHLIARDAIDLTRPRWRDLAQKQGRAIEVRRDLLPVPSLIGRAGALRDVVTNLIINAIDAMPQGGTLTVRTYQIPEPGDEPLAPDTPLEVVVQVSDTGTGMAPDVRTRIFERYFTTKGRAGTGQGLSEVQEKATEHGGSVEVASEPGKGSTFTVRLPVRGASDADLIADAAARDVDTPMTPAGILVIEDEELVRLPLVRLLTRWGHRVAEAT